MAVTDLTNTKWLWNEHPSYHSNATIHINFISNSETYTHFTFDNDEGFTIIYSSLAYYTGEWQNEAYRTIEITGGTDATNADFIAYLTANATQIVEAGKMYIGTSTISKMYIGQDEVEKIYFGQDLVYEKPSTQLGTFYIMSDLAPFNFEIGMTWAEFVDSNYNTNNIFTKTTDSIFYDGLEVMKIRTPVIPIDTIIDESTYRIQTG